MLLELHIKNLALIDDIYLDFSDGFTVFTGETGAGKTVLVGALKLLLGDRADTSLVKTGATEALVEGRFLINNNEYVVSRKISSDGRSKCYLNGEMTTISTLSATLKPYVDLHGQHDHQKLLNSSAHVSYLDKFIGEEAIKALTEYQNAKAERSKSVSHHKKLLSLRTVAAQEKSFTEFQLQEIENINPLANEDETIENELPKLRHGEKLTEAISSIHKTIDTMFEIDGESKFIVKKVEGLDDSLDELLDRYEKLKNDLNYLNEELLDYGKDISFNPERLNKLEGRLNSINLLKKKYGPTLKEVIDKKEALKYSLEMLDGNDNEINLAKQKLVAMNKVLKEKATNLNDIRKKHIGHFEKQIITNAKELNLPEAKFNVQIIDLAPEEWDDNGPQKIEFLFTSNRGEPLKPLAKIASGGEISRVMLAIKGVLGENEDIPLMVFDEIDTGIGGSTGTSIGKQIKELSKNHQIFVITHLAQVAAFAKEHLVVEKLFTDNTTTTNVKKIDSADRIKEIARMLSGESSESAIKHAQEMIEKTKEI